MTTALLSSEAAPLSAKPPRPRRTNPLASPRVQSILLLITLLGSWEGAVRLFKVPRHLVPPVSDIAIALWRGLATGPFAKDGFWYHGGITLAEILLGFFVGGGIGLAIGIVVVAPTLQMPAVTQFAQGNGPVWSGNLFPFLFITIACGAVSGFHALISSGTTPKMLDNERHARFIGYGGMLAESFVAVMALVAASCIEPACISVTPVAASAASISGASRPISTTARAYWRTGSASGSKSWPLPSPPRITTTRRSSPRPPSAATVAPTLVPLLSSKYSTSSISATGSTRCGSPRYSRRP